MNEGIHLDLDTWIVPGQINLSCHVLIGSWLLLLKKTTSLHLCLSHALIP